MPGITRERVASSANDADGEGAITDWRMPSCESLSERIGMLREREDG